MAKLRLSFVLLVFLGVFCTVNSNVISNFFGKGGDEVTEGSDKTTASTPSAAEQTTTTTASPETVCGGLKGFLHICDKTESTTEQQKNVKARSVRQTDEDDSDEDTSESDEDSEEKSQEKTTEATVNVSKRQVGDPDAPVLGEIPPVVEDALKEPPEDDGKVEKRQVESENATEVTTDSDRKKRDCRDGDEDGRKDCRRKRDYVPDLSNSEKPPTEN